MFASFCRVHVFEAFFFLHSFPSKQQIFNLRVLKAQTVALLLKPNFRDVTANAALEEAKNSDATVLNHGRGLHSGRTSENHRAVTLSKTLTAQRAFEKNSYHPPPPPAYKAR